MFLYGDHGLNRPVYDDVRKLRALADDLEGIAAGARPTAETLASAPSLDAYRIAPWPRLCLRGAVENHPIVTGPWIATSDLWVLAPELGWARTYSRFYQLGFSLEDLNRLNRDGLQ